MNDLLQTMAVAGGPGGQWTCSSEYLEGPEHAGDTPSANGRGRQRMKELAFSTNAIDCATLTLPSRATQRTTGQQPAGGTAQLAPVPPV